MANTNYSYPRVTMSTLAKKHSHNKVNVPDTTIMFAPLWTEKGPDDKLVKVHTLAEFIETFGSFNEEFYNMNGQMALNVYNWLSNGGTLLVKRFKSNKVYQYIFNTNEETYVTYTYEVSTPEVGTDVNENEKIDILFDYPGHEVSDSEKLDLLLHGKGVLITVIDNGEDALGENDVNMIYKSNDTYKFETIEQGDGTGNEIVTSRAYRVCLKEGTDEPKTHTGYTFTITKNKVESKISKQVLSAKYSGEFYNEVYVSVDAVKENSIYNVNIEYKNSNKKYTSLEKFSRVTAKTYAAVLSKSEYVDFSSISFENLSSLTERTQLNSIGADIPKDLPVYIPEIEKDNDGKVITDGSGNPVMTSTLVLNFWTSGKDDNYEEYLLNRLETPIDIIMDAGYNNDIKSALHSIFSIGSTVAERTDVFLILDVYSITGRLNQPKYISTLNAEGTNIAVYEQYFTILDEVFTSQHIYVTPTYFLSKLIPYNDNTYGIQYPTAGLRRGILDDALAVNKNPDADTKEGWFVKRVNYVEKSSREYAFMSQRTHDGSDDFEYTALSFMNNSRVLEKMKKELEAIGRSYLHEFNDAVTIANMTVALNKYVSNWISNRTLSMGVVEVAQNEVSENALDINLTIKFTNTIEVINVSIVIE